MITYDELIKNLNVLLVDDDEDFINIACMYLKSKGYNIDVVNNGKDAIETLKQEKHQIVLLDYFMPDISGEDVVVEVRKFNQEVVIIMQTGFAGQKPPIDTMQRLNIQNYHDKTEGMDKLNLELISAVKIFNQQNEIAISKYKSNAIGKLISSIVLNIKSNLMSIGAGLEITNMIINEARSEVGLENIAKLGGFYETNKESLEKIDKVLTAIIKETNSGNEEVMSDAEIIEVINLILINELKQKGIKFASKVSLRTNSYITGNVNDIVFIICEIIFKLIKVSENESAISFTLTEDEMDWYFIVESDQIKKISNNDLYLLKNIVLSIKNANLIKEENSIKILLKK
ncbi:MAG: response regulator receiver modulated diguanylate cyclase [Clostridia bacterium]|jgi:CheY-like chemotaxis protein|nr:response regulator receiver modulated diguanylate cyclase [Clostridia bacterium]